MEDDQPSVLLFKGFRLDLARGCLRSPGGTELLLRPKSFDVLRHMLEHAGRLVSRDELMQAVWSDVIVTDDSITQCITEVRRVLGDEGQRILKTVPRRGYLLEAEVARDGAEASRAVTTEDRAASDQRAGTMGGASRPTLLDLPSLVVLPFANLSGDPEQEYFADGMTEELTTALSRGRWFFVIARNSAFTYKGRAVDVRQVGRDLGVRYVLEGSVRKSGGRLRITAQLTETHTGHHIWADRFDGNLEDIFELQDRVAEAVAGAMEPNLRAAEIERAVAKPTESLDAYDLYLRAIPLFYTHTRGGNDAALTYLRQAISLDPGFTLAKAFAAAALVNRKSQAWSSEDEWAEGLGLARQALSAAPDDPNVLRLASLAIVNFGGDFNAGLAAVERALALNPNSAGVLAGAGWTYNYACEPAKAISAFERAMRLSPLDPEMAHTLSGSGLAHLMTGNLEAALHLGERSVRHTPAWLSGHRVLIAALMQLSREGEARDAVSYFRRVAPRFDDLAVSAWLQRNHKWLERHAGHEWLERYVAALRAAGLPG